MGLRIRLALALAGLVAVAGLAHPPAAGAQRGPRIGQPAPDIAGGPWINSAPLSMATLRGRVVYVDFWTYG
jgi:hypothetical protein